ncbi:hypothetical protein R0135_12125 [Congregibacter variabilis]|uniref:Nucleotide-diphospho-sugar transferase domain-containing protein n=1 Tax=Congregibacter variabilis TaxID=3081200 RepID=A0ABZ0I172_9GAMM|nr:hypothetical protein R0135_12125 [Congregibacter sp. IMCC43200]
MGSCCASVSSWASQQGFDYLLDGDALFDRIPVTLRARFAAQVVVLSDLARLYWMREVLESGYDRAIWCDADVLIFEQFTPADSGDRFGRECWIQQDGGKLRRYRKIHNAWMQFSAGSPTLAFYLDRARLLLERTESPVVPQFIGPKLLTAWHNIAAFSVEERVGMLSPLVMAELLDGGDRALQMLRAGHAEPLCALNLSASYENREVDGVMHDGHDYQQLVEQLSSGAMLGRLRGAY